MNDIIEENKKLREEVIMLRESINHIIASNNRITGRRSDSRELIDWVLSDCLPTIEMVAKKLGLRKTSLK